MSPMVLSAYLSAIDSGSEAYIKEHHVARYVMLLIQKLFPSDRWAIIPQKYLISQKIPDLVLESFRIDIGSPAGRFIPKAYFEFKSPDNQLVNQAFDQAKQSLINEQGPNLKDKGYIFAVSGSKWIVGEFNMFITGRVDMQGRHIVNCVTFPITRYHGLIDSDPQAPTMPNKTVLDFRDDCPTIISILKWVSREKRPRNLVRLYSADVHREVPRHISSSSFESLPGELEQEETREKSHHRWWIKCIAWSMHWKNNTDVELWIEYCETRIVLVSR